MQLIAADYWMPWRAFNLGYPWLTPGAIVRLEQIIRLDWTVLELGAGGSTIWFSNRCARVTSFESSADLIAKLTPRLTKGNVEVHPWGAIEAEQVKVLSTMSRSFDLVLLDSFPGPARRALLPLTWRLANKLVVVDNYNICGLNHQTVAEGWTLETHDDFHWLGFGTAIASRIA